MQSAPPPMPVQPPPAPAKSGWSPLAIVLVCLGGVFLGIFVIAAIAGLMVPMIIQQRKKAEMSEALSNARSAGFALLEFETEYGRFPDRETAVAVAQQTGSNLAVPGTSANDHLRQLIAANIVGTEIIFYAKTAFTHQPDHRFDTPDTALAPGEVGFGYMMNGDTGLNSNIHPSAVLLCAPHMWDFKAVIGSRFDTGAYDGRIIMLHMDGSARAHRPDRATGEVMLEGHPWLANGEGTAWGTEIQPRVAVPQAR